MVLSFYFQIDTVGILHDDHYQQYIQIATYVWPLMSLQSGGRNRECPLYILRVYNIYCSRWSNKSINKYTSLAV